MAGQVLYDVPRRPSRPARHLAGRLERLAGGYDRGYTRRVKTAISIPDDLFLEAEREARRLGLSRSELYARAVRAWLEANRDSAVTEALDRLYGEEDSRLDPGFGRLQSTSLPREEW